MTSSADLQGLAGHTSDIDAIMESIGHDLPQQGPIKDFIHHNTLHAFQDMNFHDGVAEASRRYRARSFMPLSFYHQAYKEQRIVIAALDLALSDQKVSERDLGTGRSRLLGGIDAAPDIQAGHIGKQEKISDERLRLDLLIHPMLFRLVANFLDQGLAIWPMPGRHGGFWEAINALATNRLCALPPLSDPEARRLLTLGPKAALEICLQRLVAEKRDWHVYLLNLCLAHPGWSGMVRMIETQPQVLTHPRKISLIEVVALEAIFQCAWLARMPQSKVLKPEIIAPASAGPAIDRDAKVWHEALEWTYYGKLLAQLKPKSSQRTADSDNAVAKAQAFFCIDDREGSLRRNLEAVWPDVVTFGAPGFFGVDFLFQGAEQSAPQQHCPVILTPKHVVREAKGKPQRGRHLRRGFHLWEVANTGIRGWISTPLFGLWAAIKLSLQVIWPRLQEKSAAANFETTPLQIERTIEEPTQQGYWLGYSVLEMADRVGGILRNCGLVDHFAELIVMVSHGSTTTNNPHFSAYDCGACAGKPGAVNARAFATMANNAVVRKILSERGIAIPDKTYVLAAMHDTTQDDASYYDESLIPSTHYKLVAEFKRNLESALELNAQERAVKFDLAPASPKAARSHVRKRARAIFEPRPEWNHANNASAIVGRRILTRGIHLDRRAFLQSYDPRLDPTGDILAAILGAVVPVCGGINLEYFFSRVDNDTYGAGSKLPHNVMALLGVAQGVTGDLRTGLPAQMVEIHDPVRLLVVVEQNPVIASKAAKKNPAIFQWIENEWVRFAAVDPETGSYWIWRQGGFVPFEPKALVITQFSTGQAQ